MAAKSAQYALNLHKLNLHNMHNIKVSHFTVMDGVINGFSDMPPSQKKGLKDIIDSSLIRGLYTWSREGGWWGPYIHGREFWLIIYTKIYSF